MRTRPQRTEAQIEYACDRVVREHDGLVITLGRHSVSQCAGLPTRRYHVHGVPMWWAPRSDRGRLTHSVSDLLVREHSMGQFVGAGDDVVLRAVLRSMSVFGTDEARHVAWQCFRDVADRGLVGRSE